MAEEHSEMWLAFNVFHKIQYASSGKQISKSQNTITACGHKPPVGRSQGTKELETPMAGPTPNNDAHRL